MVKLTPTEKVVFDSLIESPKRPTDISCELKISLPNISRYLSTLRRLGLIEFAEEPGNQRIYSVVDDKDI